MAREDFDIRISDDNQLVVTVEKRTERGNELPTEKEWAKVDQAIEKGNEGRYLRREFSYTHFRQAIILSDNIKKNEAKMQHGVLDISIPKSPSYVEMNKALRIEIK